MPRPEKTIEQYRKEAEKAQQALEKKIEQERKKIMEQFFKDNPKIETLKDYKAMKKEQPVPVAEKDEIAELSKALILKYAKNIVLNSNNKVEFAPRDLYHDFFKDLLLVTSKIKDK